MAELRFPLKTIRLGKSSISIWMPFASVEERDNPELAKHPLVIARHPSDTGGRGVVTTANYKARQYGIHSAMSAQKPLNCVLMPSLYLATIRNTAKFLSKSERSLGAIPM